MPTLDDFFKTSADVPLHPRLRNWKLRLDQGATAEIELYRSPTAMGLGHTEINLHFTEHDGSKSLDTFAWDDDLNVGLIELHVRAVDLHQEAERVSLTLRAALRKVEREFGDGYLNGVLLQFIRESDLTEYPEIKEVLPHTHGHVPEQSRSRNLCREMIDTEIRARAYELTVKLGYDEANAKQILVSALARYLDERFSVSYRRRMGLL